MAKGHQAFLDSLKEGRSEHSKWEKEARVWYQFFSLKQWDDKDVASLREEGRPALAFDRTRPIVQAILGSQVTQRYQATFLPRRADVSQPDGAISESATEVGRYHQARGNFEQIETLAFQDCLVTGVGALEMLVEFDNDPDGEIKLKRKPVGSVLWDPTSIEPNMLDRGWHISSSWVDRKEAASLYGGEAAEAILRSSSESEESSSQRIQQTIPAYSIFSEGDTPVYDKSRDRVHLYERQCFERTYMTRVLSVDAENPDAVLQAIQSGGPLPKLDAMFEKSGSEAKIQDLQARIDAINVQMTGSLMGPIEPPIVIKNFPSRIYYRSIHTQEELIYEEVMKNGFTILFLTCFEDWSDEKCRRFFGVVKPMMDPQQYANKFLSQAVHLFTSNPKGALLYDPTLFENVAKAAQEWARATGMIPTRPGALASGQKLYEQLQSNVSLNNVDQLLAYAMNAVPASVGISESSFLGTSGDIRRVSGEAVNSLLQQQQKTQVLPFDSLRLYRKEMGRLLLSYMEQYMSDELAIRILGDPNDPFIAALKDGSLTEEYDVVVEESPISPNEKQQIINDLVESNFLSQLMTAGIPIPPELANFFKIPSKAAAQFKQSLELAYQVQTLSMQLQQLELRTRLQLPPGAPLPGEMMMGGGGELPPGEEGGGPPPPEEA